MPNELRVLVRDEGYDVAVLVNGHYLEGGRFPHLMKWKDGKTAWDMAALQVVKLGADRVTLCPNDSIDDEGLKHIKLLESHGLLVDQGTRADNVHGWVHL